jgi:hypothetical protein
MEIIAVALIENKVVASLLLFLLVLIIIETLAITIKAKSGPLAWVDNLLTTFVHVTNRRGKKLFKALLRLFNKNTPN